MTLRLFLFGSPTVEYGGESVALPFERRNQLLVFLALKRSWVGRAELAAMFWPEQESKLAYANLRKILHRLQSLRWASSIESQGAALRFEAETDVFAFESALREQRIAEALPMRRGELLAGFDDDQSEAWSSWLNFERDRLRVAWREAALNRLTAEIDAAEGIDLSKRLLDADPLDEAALRAHMSWLARSGQSARARQAYHEFVARLADDLGLAPGAELRALHDSLGMPISPPRSAEAAASIKLDAGFIGRTIELRRIASLLAQDDCRLLCLVGPGGIGKTRLAQRAMHELAPSFSDGAAFVPLEDVDSSNELGARIARELDVRLAGRQDPLDQVIEFLHERQMLLVLDNFEQLAADVSILERLLQACARLKILVTSRVRLAVSMEWLLPVEGLPCPEIEDQDHFEAFDAVRLFVQAAQRVEPALVPAVEAASIVDICRQVGGLPLALELAAAWTRVLSCDAIAAELRQGTELLQAADAARPARHASIEIVFEQSWRSLSPVERDSLSRLSVFRGGFTAEAARAIAGARLPVLGALADKSLLRKEEARIFMHPLVQQLAELRLSASDHRESTERAHALYFHRSLAQLRRPIENGDREALRQVDSELENYRVAWTWSIAHEDGNTLVRSAPTLLQFFDHSGRFGEGVALLSGALETPVASTNLKLSALLLGAVGQLQFRLDRYAQAMATATRAREAAKRARDPDSHALSLQVLGSCSLRLVKHEDARRFFKAGLEQALAAEDQRKANTMLHNSALVEKLSGNQDDALRIFLEALSRHRALGDFVGEALSLANLGLLYAEKGDLETASSYLRAGLDICDRHGFASTRVLILANLTGLAIKTNDLASAEKYGKTALDIAQATDNRHVISSVKVHFSRLALRRGDLERARSDLEASLRIANQIDRPALVLEGISCFAEILAAQGDKDCARMVLTFATNHPLSNAPERNEYLAKLAQWGNEPSQESAWPGIELNELAQRIVIESNVAHAPLIATLRGAH